jgi:hypothetical protein
MGTGGSDPEELLTSLHSDVSTTSSRIITEPQGQPTMIVFPQDDTSINGSRNHSGLAHRTEEDTTIDTRTPKGPTIKRYDPPGYTFRHKKPPDKVSESWTLTLHDSTSPPAKPSPDIDTDPKQNIPETIQLEPQGEEIDSVGSLGFKSAQESEIIHHHRKMTTLGFHRVPTIHAPDPPLGKPKHGVHFYDQEFLIDTTEANSVPTATVQAMYITKPKEMDVIPNHADKPPDLFSDEAKWGTYAYAHLVQRSETSDVSLLIPESRMDEYKAYTDIFNTTSVPVLTEHYTPDDFPEKRTEHQVNHNYLAVDNGTFFCENPTDLILAQHSDTYHRTQHPDYEPLVLNT